MKKAYQLTKEAEVFTDNPVHLISLLFDEFTLQIGKAMIAIEDQDDTSRIYSHDKAFRILQEGLLASLDFERGDQIANNLKDIYEYLITLMFKAKIDKNLNIYKDILNIIEPIHLGWKELETLQTS